MAVGELAFVGFSEESSTALSFLGFSTECLLRNGTSSMASNDLWLSSSLWELRFLSLLFLWTFEGVEERVEMVRCASDETSKNLRISATPLLWSEAGLP